MIRIARWTGVLASVGTLGLYIVLEFFSPYVASRPSPGSVIVILQLMALSAAGALVAWKANPYLMLVISVLLFFPFGLYFLGTPGIFRGIGIFNLIFILCGLILLSYRIPGIVERLYANPSC